ncbi:MAG TPA: anchored repeat-type ABC transporter permease subunit [Dehalococcoidia bacterium]|nr:anchored repeat-type ABC transporter permease subunit [Dehalococcoidia bacterium]
MSSFIDYLAEPWDYEFMRRAFLATAIVGAVAGLLGTYVVLRGLAFIGDAIAHAAFPGVVIAFLLDRSLFLGGAIFGLATAVSIGAVSQTRRIREDTAIGVLFAAAFALGVVLISTEDAYTGNLAAFLFGQVLAVSETDIALAAGFGAAIVVVALALQKELIAVAFDRDLAQSMGLPVFWLDLLLFAMVTMAIVISLRAVGNILVVAMLVTPAATARLLTDRVYPMMALSTLLGAASGIIGLYISFHEDLAAGGLIVLVVTAFFALAWLFSPKYGIVTGAARRFIGGRAQSDA